MAGGGYWVRRISSSISLIFSLTPMVEYYSRFSVEWEVLLCVGGIKSGSGGGGDVEGFGSRGVVERGVD